MLLRANHNTRPIVDKSSECSVSVLTRPRSSQYAGNSKKMRSDKTQSEDRLLQPQVSDPNPSQKSWGRCFKNWLSQ
ncbi:hypothetical protein EVAR_13385_1 [Eumeta japonica]|uniref:Uncharacterized protein n=1 Tax=Eumeta variegata TaxID=151549 RepID=A0A4C1TS04_EUMVA|nr:hypothetical protein EVAR_13385_1 [Eumeta japonica]